MRQDTFDGEACIRLLQDKTQPLVERDAAAESLAFYPTAAFVDALFEVMSDPAEELLLRETAASSLGTVWSEVGVDNQRLNSLPEGIRFEVVASMPSNAFDFKPFIEEIVGQKYVRQTDHPFAVHIAEGWFQSTILGRPEPKMLPLLLALQQRYAYTYLWLDPIDDDMVEEFKNRYPVIGESLFQLPTDQRFDVWWDELYRGHWELYFSQQPVKPYVQLFDVEAHIDNFPQLLSRVGAEVVVLAWPDNSEWTVGWRSQG